MESEILPRSLSTAVTQTVTVSPTATTSLGCLTKRSASLETCTSPSCFTPTSTNAPKSTTLRTVPVSSMPGARSSKERMPLLNTTSGAPSRGSRPGFSSSATMSRRVGRPTPSSAASAGRSPRRLAMSGTPPRASASGFTFARFSSSRATG